MSDLTYYQRNRDVLLNKEKDYYENDKERLRKQAKDKYINFSEEEEKKMEEINIIICLKKRNSLTFFLFIIEKMV